MDYKYIEQLLERYFEAQTTEQEEQILKAFFNQNEANMPQELSQYRPLFEALEQKEELDEEFDQRLLTIVNEQPVVKAREIRLTERLRPLFRAAAVVAIVFTLSTALNNSFQSSAPQEPQSDGYAEYITTTNEPAMAYEQPTVSVQHTDSLHTDTLEQ